MAIADPPTPLSFPPLTYAKLSPGPFLHAHLTSTPPLRPNTRAPSAFRPLTTHTGSLTHAHGSAVVRIGDTAVVCGVRAEVLRAEDVANYRPTLGAASTTAGENDNDAISDEGGSEKDTRATKQDTATMAALGLLVPNVELQTGCSPAHLPGSAPSALAQSLAHRVVTLLHSTSLVPLAQLRIWHTPAPAPAVSSQPQASVHTDAPAAATAEQDDTAQQPEVKAFWVLYIDLLFLSLDGTPFDAAWAAVLAALADTALPRAWWDADRGAVVCSPLVAEAIPLVLRGCPVVGTFGVFEGAAQAGGREGMGNGGEDGGGGAWILADPDDFEEGLCAETVTVVVDGEEGRVLRVEKSGGGVVGVGEMRACAEMVRGRGREWLDVLGRGREG
ncbi:hypothetical protein MMC18_009309 [Xylographa bjoerkii]|nr:hypothetical protein [Xylographa bjoerkii]